MTFNNISKRTSRNNSRNRQPLPIPQQGWRGVNSVDSIYAMPKYHLPYSQNADLGNPIEAITKVKGRETLFDSLGAGKILGQKIWRHFDGDKYIFAWDKNLYLNSGSFGSIVKSSQADWESGTGVNIDTTTTAGDITLTTSGTNFSETDTLTADFSGTHDGTVAASNSVQIEQDTGAARFYITGTAAGYNPATERGAWEVIDGHTALKLSKTKSGAIAARMNKQDGINGDVLIVKAVTDAVTANKTIEGTLKWCFGVKEEKNQLHETVYHVHAFVTVGDSDNVRGTLLSDFYDTQDWKTTLTALAVGEQTLTPVAAQVGDRVVIEIGSYQSGYYSSCDMTINTGGTSSTDLTTSGDATLYPGWFEFSGDPVSMPYALSTTYTHGEQDISAVTTVDSATITFNTTTPANTSVVMQTRYTTDGTTWSTWTTRASGATIIPQGTDVSNLLARVQWRAILANTTGIVTPSLNDVTISITSGLCVVGNWVSDVLDLGNTPLTAILSWVDTEPTGTLIKWFATSSGNGTVFGDWQTIVNTGDAIPLQRFIKIMTVMEGTVTATPKVSSFLISYTNEYSIPNKLDISSLGRTDNLLTGNRVSMEEYNDRLYCADGLRPFCLYVDDDTETTGTAQGGATDYITLAAGASAVDDFYNNAFITITGGKGSGQVRFISDYSGINKRVTPSVIFDTAPDNTSQYSISSAVKVRNAGVDIPDSACSAAAGAETGLTGTFHYKYTFVNRDGYESNPSDASSSVTVSNQKISVSNIAVGDSTIVSRKIYRTKNNGSVYYFVDEIEDNTTTTYTDTKADSYLVTLMLDNNNIPPNCSLIYPFLTYMFYIFLDELWFSNATEPEAVPAIVGDLQVIVCPDRILDIKSNPMALIPQGDSFIAPITTSSGFIFDSDPTVDTTTMRIIDKNGSFSAWASDMCISPDLRSVLVFPTNTGVRTLLPGMQEESIESLPLSRNVQDYFNRSVNRTNMAGIFFENRYIISFEHMPDGAAESEYITFIYDFRTSEWNGPWAFGASNYAIGGNVLYAGDPINGKIYRMFTGYSDDGENIKLIADLPILPLEEGRTYKFLNFMVIMSADSDTTDTIIKVKVDDHEATITLGALTSTFTGDTRPGHNFIRSKKFKIPLPRGSTCSYRLEDDSTNPISLLKIITEVELIPLKK